MQNAPTFTAILQPKGLLHRFIRSKDTSTVVERPERLRAVAVGIAAAAARLEDYYAPGPLVPPLSTSDSTLAAPTVEEVKAEPDEIADALQRLAISPQSSSSSAPGAGGRTPVFNIISASNVSVDLLNHDAVRFVHGEAHEYIAKLDSWAINSEAKIKAGESEIPTGYSQGDLYLCPQSIEAIAGAISAVCEAVDLSIQGTCNPTAAESIELPVEAIKDIPAGSSMEALTSALQSVALEGPHVPATATTASEASNIPLPPSPGGASAKQLGKGTPRVFAAIRPPGHHCSDEMPSGFCFVNNVMIGVAHAHLKYGIKRFVVLDFDLHHGNGTQAIAWSINSETRRQEEESKARVDAGLPPLDAGPKVYYGSLHDIMSFPCEDGDAALVQAASTTLHGAHGQYVENVHLETYSSEEDFFNWLYPGYHEQLLGGAAHFLTQTAGPSATPNDTMIFVSAGFDASPHEHSYMSRHNRNVPTAFYTRFAQDVVAFADEHAGGRVVSVLEGGYSDWALMSASAAYISGLVAPLEAQDIIDQKWWEPDSLEQLQSLLKPSVPGAKPRLSNNSLATESFWLSRVREITSTLMDAELFSALPPLPNLRVPRKSQPTTSSAQPGARMTLRDRTRREPVSSTGPTTASKGAGAGTSHHQQPPQSPPRKPRQTRTPSRTPISSPPKQQRPTSTPPTTSASRRTPSSAQNPASTQSVPRNNASTSTDSKPVSKTVLSRASRPVPTRGPTGGKEPMVTHTHSKPSIPSGPSTDVNLGRPVSSAGPTTDSTANAQHEPLKIRIKVPNSRAKPAGEMPPDNGISGNSSAPPAPPP